MPYIEWLEKRVCLIPVFIGNYKLPNSGKLVPMPIRKPVKLIEISNLITCIYLYRPLTVFIYSKESRAESSQFVLTIKEGINKNNTFPSSGSNRSGNDT